MGWFKKAVWEAELDGAVFMTQTLSRDWVGYSKSEFLEKMPGTWHGAAAEDKGAYVAVRNPGLHRYFEFHFMVDEERENSPISFLITRGLNELRSLWILGQSEGIVSRLEPEQRGGVTRDAQKAAAILQKKFGVRCAS